MIWVKFKLSLWEYSQLAKFKMIGYKPAILPTAQMIDMEEEYVTEPLVSSEILELEFLSSFSPLPNV